MLRRTKETRDKEGRLDVFSCLNSFFFFSFTWLMLNVPLLFLQTFSLILELPPTDVQVIECEQSEEERDFYTALFKRSKVSVII